MRCQVLLREYLRLLLLLCSHCDALPSTASWVAPRPVFLHMSTPPFTNVLSPRPVLLHMSLSTPPLTNVFSLPVLLHMPLCLARQGGHVTETLCARTLCARTRSRALLALLLSLAQTRRAAGARCTVAVGWWWCAGRCAGLQTRRAGCRIVCMCAGGVMLLTMG